MSEKISKSLKEVWEWKEACYQELKDLSPSEQRAHIEREVNRVLDEAGLEKVPTGNGTYLLRRKNAGNVSEKTYPYCRDCE